MKTIGAAILKPAVAGRISQFPRRLAGGVAALLIVGTCSLAVADEPTGLGDRVVGYCKQHKGKCVGNGSCTIFVAAALQSAGAALRGPDGPNGTDHVQARDFNWGELFYVLERDGTLSKVTGQINDVRPGDIIQFTNTTLTGALDDYASYTMKAKNHSAIVARVEDDATVLKIYHQGANGRKRVSLTSLRLGDLQRGRFSIYHPVPRAVNQPPKKHDAAGQRDNAPSPDFESRGPTD